MKKLLVVVDMQNDFIDGALANPDAEAIVPKIVDKINKWDGHIVATQDTHTNNYLNTLEGKKLPIPHCIWHTNGWSINTDISNAIAQSSQHHFEVYKKTFGSNALAKICTDYDYIEFVGTCTDICVISNALLAKTACPNIEIAVDASCCAGTTEENHKAALQVMKMCQIDIINEKSNNKLIYCPRCGKSNYQILGSISTLLGITTSVKNGVTITDDPNTYTDDCLCKECQNRFSIIRKQGKEPQIRI